MRERVFRAPTVREALARVRRDLGGDAIILGMNEVRRRRLFGRGMREVVEVIATMPEPARSRGKRAVSEAPRPAHAGPDHAAVQGRLSGELGQLHAVVDALCQAGRLDHLLPDLPTELVPHYADLIERDVPESLARRLLRTVAEVLEAEAPVAPDSVGMALARVVASALPIAPPIRPVPGARRVVALVGPTGVGKTTTVAKLAAGLKLCAGAAVGLVTADTYRIAAAEQLRTYAEILGVPLAVAGSPEEMPAAIEALGPVDLVLIDTAGRNPRDEAKLRELGEVLAAARPDEVHLVLAATSTGSSLRVAVERFAAVRADRLILTKLDEAGCLGRLLAVLLGGNRPVSYLATGQAVPDDLEAARRERLARLVLGVEAIPSGGATQRDEWGNQGAAR